MDTEKYRPTSPSAPVPSVRSGAESRVAAHSAAMSAALARNWWAVGLRSLVALAFAIAVILLLPRPTLGALVLLFAAYLAADGALAIVAGVRAMRRGELRQALMFEGAANLMVAGAVLIWPAMAAVAFVRLTSAWAIVTGALLFAAARRLARSHGRWLLVLAGALSVAWGALAAAVGPSAGSTPETMGWWLVGYALPFAIVLLALAGLLQWRDRKAFKPASGST